jgi:hypothetical protein
MIFMLPAFVSDVKANCCPDGSIQIDASSETVSTSSLPGNYYNGKVCIKNGILQVDTDYTFENAELHFEDNAGMEVQSGITLTILESLLTACEQNGMWESVFVGDDATLIIEDSHIEQGYQAFYLNDEFSFTAINNEFLNNLISVTVESPEPNIYFEVHGNLFTSNGNFNASVYSSNFNKPYHAFRLSNGFNITIGSTDQNADRNIIEKVYYGIYGVSANFSVVNTTFRDIVPNSSLTDAPGIGVYSQASGTPPNVIIGGYQANGKAVSFEWSHTGVKTKNTNLHFSHSFMSEVVDGIYIENCEYTYVLIADNEIVNERSFVTVSGCDRANSIVIEDNLIGIGFVENYMQGKYGIGEFTTGFGHFEARIERNLIRFISDYGILMEGSKGWLIRDNYVSYSDEHIETVSAVAGIMLSGCEDMELYCNEVQSQQNELIGIGVIQSEASKMLCNITSGTHTGVYFQASCLDTEFKGHFFDRSEIGLHLNETAVIGIQEHHGNLWMDPPYNPSAKHDANDPNVVDFSQFIVSDQNYPLFAEQFQAVTSDWFDYDPTGAEIYFKCEDELELCQNNYAEQPLEFNEILYNLPFATGSYSLDKHENGQKAMHRQNLFNKLMVVENIETIGFEMDTFFTAGLNDERYTKYIRDLLLHVPVLSSNSFVTSVWHEQIKLAMQGYETTWELDSLLAWMANSYLEQIASLESKLMEVQEYNQTLAESEESYYYYSGVFNELLHKHYLDSLVGEDIALLYDVALQCPFDAGNAVYHARSLIRNYGFQLNLDDELLCSSVESMPQMQQMSEVNLDQFKVYPVPSNGQLIVEGKGEFKVQIYNLTGKLLMQSDVVSEKLVMQLNLPSGIYFSKITTLEGEIFTYQIPLINIER